MSTKKKFFLVFGFIVLDIFLVIGFLTIRDTIMLNNLKKEVNELNKLDVTKNRYNRELVTSGDYAIVESAIKEYLDNYALLLQDSLKVVKDPKLLSILSYDNYVTDGPDFTSSLEYLNEGKTTFNSNIDLLLSYLEEDKIRSFIKEKTTDEYYVNLYCELMFADNMKGSLEDTKTLLLQTKDRMNTVCDTSIETLTFLSTNKDNWTLDEGQIKFLEEDLYNQYLALINKLNNK